MPIAYFTTKGMKVSLQSERLEVTVPRHAEGQYPERRSIPLVDIEHVVVDAGVALSTPALCGLLRKNIPVLFMAHGTFPSGHAIPAGASTAVLAAQLDRARDPAFRLEQSRRLIVAKIKNQKRFQEEDFEYRDGGCFLRRDSRRKLFGALENRLEREFLHEQAGHRTTLRQVIKDHCYQAKRAFNEGCPLRPFRMN